MFTHNRILTRRMTMTTRKSVTGILWLLVTFLSITSCGGASGPTDPPDPPPPLPSIVAVFPGAQMVGNTITIFEGDSLGCDFALVPPQGSINLGLNYRGSWDLLCYGAIGGDKWVTWGTGGVVVFPVGTQLLTLQLFSGSGAKLGDPVLYTLVVVKRGELPVSS